MKNNKKTYESPLVIVDTIGVESFILAGSGSTQSYGEGDPITDGGAY